VCTKTLTQGQIEQFSQMIQHNYKYKLNIDGLPSATILRDKKNKELPVDYQSGIPIGEYHGLGKIMIYNHLDIVVRVHTTMEGHHRIVGFEVEPYSMAEGPHRVSNNPTIADEDQYLRAGEPFSFTYRTIMRNDETTRWAMRMDHYYALNDNDINMAQILWAFGIVCACFYILMCLLGFSLKNDF